MAKQYISVERTLSPRPRSKRRRETGEGGSSGNITVVQNGGGSSSASVSGDGHTHDNKSTLDKLGIDGEGYVTVTDWQENGDGDLEKTTSKSKAGYADKAYDLAEDSPVWSNIIKRFLSRTEADTAEELITFNKGLRSLGDVLVRGVLTAWEMVTNVVRSGNYTAGLDGTGYELTADNGSGSSQLTVDIIEARKKLIASSVEIKESHAVAGDQIINGATAEISRVDYYDAGHTLLGVSEQSVPLLAGKLMLLLAKTPLRGIFSVRKRIRTTLTAAEISSIEYVRCYFLSKDDDREVENWWQADDLALCKTQNLVSTRRDQRIGMSSVQRNIYWWRRVDSVSTNVGTNTNGTPSGDDSGGPVTLDDGKSYHWIEFHNIPGQYDADSDLPCAGDKAVQFGNTRDPDRMNAILLEVNGSGNNRAPALVMLRGIYTFDLTKCWWGGQPQKCVLSPSAGYKFVGSQFSVVTEYGAQRIPVNRGAWTQIAQERDDYAPYGQVRKCYYYDEVSHLGSLWLCTGIAEAMHWRAAEAFTYSGTTYQVGDVVPDEVYAALADADKLKCEHRQNYTTEAPRDGSTVWTKQVSKGDKGDSVKIAGYADYHYSVYPCHQQPGADGDISLLDYSNGGDMIDVGVIDDMEDLTGHWEKESVDYGTCFILRYNKHLYQATESGWQDLGKFLGDNGNGILSVTRTYAVSSSDKRKDNSTSDTVEPLSINGSWSDSSPAVNETYPYLWTKEGVRYTNNTQTTKYYCIGARGANGVDAQDIEWVYVRTTENVAPVIVDDGTENYKNDDFLPLTKVSSGRIDGATEAGANATVRCTDDPQGVTPEWKYEWEMKREKGQADDNGHRAWTAYSGEMTVHNKWAEDGTSPIVADLDNEMDSVACDADGHPVQINGSNQSVSSNFKLFHGSSEEKFYISSVSPSSRTGVTITATPTTKANAATSGSLTVTYNGTGDNRATIDGKDEFTIELTADSDSNIKRQLTFTVNGVRPGADGEDATIYSIKPTVNSIAFARDANGNLTPNEVSFYLECEKSQGGTIENPVISHVGTVLYGTANAPTDADFNPSTAAGHHVAVWGNDLDGIEFNDTYNSIATVPNSFAYNQIYIALFKVVTENGSTSYILLDRETIPIVRDGAKGTDGKDGKDGIDGTDGKDGEDGNDGEDGLDAWTLTVNPSPVIIEQDIYTDNFPFSANNPMHIDFAAKCGNDTATVGTVTYISNDLGLTVSAVNSDNSHRLAIIGYGKVEGQWVTAGKIRCSVQLSYGGRTTTMEVAISVGVTLLAEWETKISDGVERNVATKLGFTDSGGDIVPLEQVGEYIRGWAENTSRLSETVGNLSTSNGNNLFGFSKGAIFDGSVPFVQGYGMACVWNNGQAYSRVWNLDFGGKPGYYVVTCEIKAQSEANIKFFLADVPPVDGVGLTKVGNELKVAATTQWKKITAVYNLTVADIANSNGQLTIRDGSTSNHVFIRKLQIEHGSVPSDFGFCKEDEMNISDPVNGITWPVNSQLTQVTAGNAGPGGTADYIYNSSNPSQGDMIDLVATGLSLTAGFYTLSFWAKASDRNNDNVLTDVARMRCYIRDEGGSYAVPNYIPLGNGNLEAYQSESMVNDGETRIDLSAAWRKYYVRWYLAAASSNISVYAMRILYGDTGADSKKYSIAQIKLEKGFVTSANRTEYSTVMKQTARNIDFSVLVNSMEKAGIHMRTETDGTPENEAELAKGVIDLAAGKVNFVDPNGDPYQNPKVSIDPRTGALHAVDGEFSGTMTAAGGSMYFGKDGSWTGMATVDSVVGGFADIVTVGMRNDGVGEKKTGRIVLQTAKKKDGVLLLSSMLKIENNNGTPGQSASGGNDGYKLTFTNRLEASGKEDKIILDGGDGSGTFAGGVSAGTVEANYILAKAGYKIQTADILTVSRQPSGSISASYQMIIVNTDSDITLTLSSTGASTGQLMIIKKTIENGWVTVKNSGGTQIGKFNSGSLVCVYNSGWQ